MNPATTSPDPITPPALSQPRALPELLAPAGDWECARAAVENGADAIYFGLDRFNARMRAHNFTEADLPALMEFLHRRGVRGYVTFNTLVFADEMPDAETYLRAVIAAGVDAAIVQDVGICRLIRRISPDFPIHGSTQMTVTSAAGVRFARDLGCSLVVLARECSLQEIEKIQQAQQEAGAETALPLEVFVHGALCVAYSGQCLTSESLGGRSANRGECAQACRLPYELISDGKPVPLGDKRYLLSPQDLAGLEVLPDLVRAGLTSLKIEGRLKSPEYVANITRVYRRALDELGQAAEVPGTGAPAGARYQLEMGFSRGLYTGWFRGINNQELAHARFGKKRGVYLGEVARVERDGISIPLEAALKPGDGVVFDAGRPDEPEEGGRVYTVEALGDGKTLVGFGYGDVNWSKVQPGHCVWKTSDPALDRELRQTFSAEKPQFLRPVDVEVHGAVGAPLTILMRDELGHVVQAASSMALGVAEKQPLTEVRLREQLGRLGGTPFRLRNLRLQLEGSTMLPVSELNRLRRELAAALEERRSAQPRWQMIDVPETPTAFSVAPPSHLASAELIVLVRSLPQLEAALRCGVGTLYCELEDPKKYREAVAMVHCAGGCSTAAPTLFVAPPRITKQGEEWILNQVRSANADGYLIRNYDHLEFFRDARRVGDFSLNVANPLAAAYFKEGYGLERLTASYDLNFSQLEALLRGAPPEWFEVTIHQHMPLFHMEHCVFCAFLSEGTDYRNCGRPCDKHEVKLRDRVGAEHLLKADAGCRNTVFNARAQTGAEYVERLLDLGVRRFRIEFLNESAEDVELVLSRYRQLLRGELSGGDLWRELKLRNQLGVTRGQMDRPETGRSSG